MEIKLQEIAGGALQEKVEKALLEVFENMQDRNTPWKNKREVVIKLKFEQNESRDDCSCQISVDKKLASVKPVGTRFLYDMDLYTGKLEVIEYGPQIKGQMNLNDYGGPEQVIGNDIVDTDTGEVIGKVKNFKAKA